ncbi:MAG: hypothetical protein WCG95_04995 [bacterium]
MAFLNLVKVDSAKKVMPQQPKKYEEVANDCIWLKDHPDKTSQYRFGGRKVVLSSDLPSDVRAENAKRMDIFFKNLTRIPTVIGMKYDTYKLEKQFKNGEITAEQFNKTADSLGLPITKGPGSMQKYANKKNIFNPTKPVTNVNNPPIK